MKIVDIKDMPDYNPVVKNGIDSVSSGKVLLMTFEMTGSKLYPSCERHGAILKVSKDGIWRCGELGCDNGCYEV